MNEEKVKVTGIDFKQGLNIPSLSQGHKYGSRPNKKIVGGSNGTFVTIDENLQSKLHVNIEHADGSRERIPIKHSIKEYTGWERLTPKRVQKIIDNPPDELRTYKDEEGLTRIVDEDLKEWGESLL